MKSILLIGVGRFGKHMALKLHELKQDVLAVDRDEEKVEEILPYVTNGLIGDSTKEQFISSLGVRNFDICIVAIGDNFQSSLETTSLLKDYGAKFVVARANSDVHGKFLLRNGADDVMYAEKETAIRAAVKYSANNVFDYIELTPEHSIFETPVPESWIGKTLVQLCVRQKFHISVLAIKKGGQLTPLSKPDHVFEQGESMLILGANSDIKKFIQF